MSSHLEIFVEMFPNIPTHHIKQIYDEYRDNLHERGIKEINKHILDKLLYITQKQYDVLEPHPCNINVLKDEKYNRFVGGIKNFFSFKNRKYKRLLTHRLE